MQTRVEYNKFTDEYFITIPDDIIELLNLKPGDILVWTIDSGKVTLSKQETA